MKDNVVLVFLLVFALWAAVLLTVVCLQGQEINRLNNRVSLLESKDFEYKSELIETEQRCERMTDSCIAILSNKTWE